MKARKFGFALGSGLVFLLLGAFLELNQHTFWGFFLFFAASFLFWLLHRRAFKSRKRCVRGLCWILWLSLFALIVWISWPPVRPVPAVRGRAGKTEVVTVAQGELRGAVTADGEVEIYAGIPYAAPPVGEYRWRPPQDPEPWDGVLSADHFGPMAMQPVSLPILDALKQIIGFHDYRLTLSDNSRAPVSEDCLYLNIWKPAGESADLPVLVYIHGGSLQTGQTWFADYSGQGLAREGVIVVNVGYRLGAFGFYADEELLRRDRTTGNYGLLDQIKALEWVRDNIAAFGGDPGNVTLAGESAGAVCVSALCTSPLASGLFRRVILESSTVASPEPPHSFRLLDEALESGKEMKEKYGCGSVAELREIPAERLVKEAESQHHITVDGRVLTETPYESYRRGVHNEEAILHGCNSEEAAPFLILSPAKLGSYEAKIRSYFGGYTDDVLRLYRVKTDEAAKENWEAIFGAVLFEYPHFCLDRLAVRNAIPVYQYRFTKDNGRLGAWHSGELVYLYGNIPARSRLYDARDRELSAQMLACMCNFIRTGDPNGEGMPVVWQQNLDGAVYMEFGEKTAMARETKLPLFRLLDEMEGWRN